MLEYFDAHLIGLTATPTKQTFGFFHQNLVMEYSHEMAVADGVNVDFTVYRIETAITEGWVDDRTPATGWATADRQTRKRPLGGRSTSPSTTAPTSSTEPSSPRTRSAPSSQTFKEKLFTEIFPGRTTVPKTLIFAKDDSHADDIVQIVREVFGKGNEFATKITYRTPTASPRTCSRRSATR